MRSSDLAALAGVTVRALRHYHQLGILDEPERSANGYREYDIRALVRLLRIKRLAGLGFSLHSLPDLLDGDGERFDSLLERLDRELDGEVARITAQRTVIAQLRRDGLAPDLPPALARYAGVFVASARSERLARFDREQAILLGHLVDEEQLPLVAELYDRLAEPDRLPIYAELNARFDALGPATTDDDIDSLVRDIVSAVKELMTALPADGPEANLGHAGALLTEYSTEVLTKTQLRVIKLIEKGLKDPH